MPRRFRHGIAQLVVGGSFVRSRRPFINDQAGFGVAFPDSTASKDDIKRELVNCLIGQMGRDPLYASKQDWFFAFAFLLRSRLSAARTCTWRRNFDADARWIYHLSLEFLPGRMLKICLLSSGLYWTR